MKFKIGHINIKDSTGVTVIISENGAIGGISVRGSAPATRETDLLKSGNAVEKINAVVLSGGSAFGLDSSGGVMRYLKERNIGFKSGNKTVPIVVGASLFDLEYNEDITPTPDDGYEASRNACDIKIENGNVGAGVGATIGKVLGMVSAVKSGLGMAEIKLGDIEVVVIVAVNAFGNVYDYKDGSLIDGATLNGQKIDIIDAIADNMRTDIATQNTTIGCVLTNAYLTRAQANKLADIAHDGYAMAIRPVHTMVDGDAVFVMADGEIECDFMKLSCIIPRLVAEAIKNAVIGAKLNRQD